MSLASQLQTAFTRVGTEFKTIRTLMTGSATGTLTGLTTTDKTSLIAAINETKAGNSGTPPDASEITKGIAELATQTETNTGTDDARIVTPLKFQTRLAAYAQPLAANLTTLAGVASGVFGRTLLTSADQAAARTSLGIAQATEAATGIAELATQAETNTGTDDLRIVTPLKFHTRLLAYAQPLAANLTTLAGVASGAFGRTLLGAADANAAKTSLGLAAVATSGSASDITTGTLPSSVLPPLAINETFTPANQAAMLALAAQRGDMAIRVDNGKTYVLSTDSPATLADWKEITAAGAITSVNGQTGPAVVVTKSDVGLGNVDNTSDANKPVSTAQQTALNLKANVADVYNKTEVGDPTTDFAAGFVAALA
jgi:hypothetical protein